MRRGSGSRGIIGLVLWLLLLASVDRAGAEDAAPAATGTIAGKVIDAATSDPIIEAGIEIVGQGKKVRTDLDGRYSLTIAPGTYELRVFAPLYDGVRLQNLVVKERQTTTADAALSPQGQAGVEVVEVVARADKAAEATQLIERKKSAVVSDNISAEQIRKSTDSNAAEIITRAPGVTVKENKFFIVRGLNERYTSALLNGSRLSSTDPDTRVVPLDLFAGDFLESLSLYKTYTPDLPGDFSAGLANIRLREFPEKLTYSFGLSSSATTGVTFSPFNTYHGPGTQDYFGFGTDYRELPNNFPSTLKAGPNFAGSRRQAFGQELRNIWDVESETALPNFDGNFYVGDTIGPVGLELSGIYTTEYTAHPEEIDNQYANAERVIPVSEFKYDVNTFKTRLGGVFSAAYNLTSDQRVTFRSLVDRNTADTVRVGEGAVEQTGGTPRTTQQLQYVEERLAFGQVEGNHHFSVADVDWRTAFTQTTQNVPDSRIVTRQDGGFTNDSSGGVRYYTNLEDHLTDSAVDITVPFTTRLPFTDVWSGLPAKLKFGPAYAYSTDDFALRQFRYRYPNSKSTQQVDPTLPTEQLLAPGNIGPFNAFDFVESGQPGDSFSGTQEIGAGYAMLDTPLYAGSKTESGGTVNQVRLVAGVRLEYSYIYLHTVDPNGQPTNVPKNDLDPLPGVNVIYSLRDDMNLRAAYSQSVSRPNFHELCPVQYPTPRGLRPTIGNPLLVEANITNYDLRWEWFFSPAEIVSASFFYKSLQKPIENTVTNTTGGFPANSFDNADNGEVTGIEFEGRKNLGILSPYLSGMNLLLNITYADSSVNVPKTSGVRAQTNTQRALQGTSPYIINTALEYGQPQLGTMRLLYNTADRNISEAGANGLPDIYQEQRNELDFVWLRQIKPFGVPVNAKFGVENMLNDRYLYTQGGLVQERYRTGVKFSFGVSYSY
jgi:outer membrane receptor protein involved in Fe transport